MQPRRPVQAPLPPRRPVPRRAVPPRRRPRPSLPWRPWLRLLGLSLLLVAVLSLAFSLYLKQRFAPAIVSLDQASAHPFDAILVFGCGVYADGSPSPMLRDRMETGIALYFKGAAPKLLLSGDHGQVHYDEVSTMRRLAEEAGVPAEDIFLDHAGFSTWDSLRRAQAIFQARSLCLVSQEYHLYRALYGAQALQMPAKAVAAEGQVYRGQLYREGREVLARVKAFFSALFQLPPQVLGPPLPLTGDGQQSWGTAKAP